MKSKAQKLQADYANMHYWWEGLDRALWRNSRFLPDDNQKLIRQESQRKMYEIKELLEKAFGEPIGKAVMEGIRNAR